jgi:hypothetical protein
MLIDVGEKTLNAIGLSSLGASLMMMPAKINSEVNYRDRNLYCKEGDDHSGQNRCRDVRGL